LKKGTDRGNLGEVAWVPNFIDGGKRMRMHVLRNRMVLCLAGAAMVVLFVSTAALGATLKKIVAVSRFENKTAWTGQVSLDDGMADQLTDALMQSGQFVVMERQTLGDVTAEQDLANSGRAQKSQSAQTGKLVNAQILVKGTVTEFENKSSGSENGVGFGGFNIGNKREEAHVGLIIRLIDTTTGEVLDSQRVEGKAASGGVKLGANVAGVGFGTSGFSKTPLGKAVQMAIDNAVSQIAAKLKNVPFQARIVKVNGDDEVLISGGQKTGIADGDVFTIYSVGEALVDPTTGEQLGSELEKKGTVKVTKVEEKYAKAHSDGSLKGIKAGDIVKGQ
jgi:curli biogenesis system outer membrane secretion channel CsgG